LVGLSYPQLQFLAQASLVGRLVATDAEVEIVGFLPTEVDGLVFVAPPPLVGAGADYVEQSAELLLCAVEQVVVAAKDI